MPFDVDGVIFTSPAGATLDVNIGAVSTIKVNSSGIMTRPQTPHYRGHLTGLTTPYFPGDHVPLKGTAIVNVGNCWNNATGLFTVPFPGKYLCQIGNICAPVHGYYGIYRNGGLVQQAHWNYAGGGGGFWRYTSQCAIVPANAGDTLSFGSWSVYAGGGWYAAGHHGMQSITLMA